jgi:DNA polymerase III alpha subunit
LIATNDVYFATQDMYEAHDALLCIADGRYVSESERRRLTEQHFPIGRGNARAVLRPARGDR